MTRLTLAVSDAGAVGSPPGESVGTRVVELSESELASIADFIRRSLGQFDNPSFRTVARRHESEAVKLLEYLGQVGEGLAVESDVLPVTSSEVELMLGCMDEGRFELNEDELRIWIGLDAQQAQRLCGKLRKLIGYEPFDVSSQLDQVACQAEGWARDRSLALARRLVDGMPGASLDWEDGVGMNWAAINANARLVGMVWLVGPLVVAIPGLAQQVPGLDDTFIAVAVDDMAKPWLASSPQVLSRVFPRSHGWFPFNLDAFSASDLLSYTITL
ncbi:MAG: hypothetical protein FWF36_08020 [Propionibacteriaceae bacterium]|nr:hypothetical protein [Propionibacteriaceae bacterium]